MSDEVSRGPEDEARMLWDTLIGEREDDQAIAWYLHLTERQRVLDAVSQGIAHERAAACWELAQEGASYATIAGLTGLTRARVQQLVERARA